MTLVTNTFEGGSDGTTITTGNSGGTSGTAFDVVTFDATGTPGVVAFSNVQAIGGLASRYQVGSVNALTCVGWSTARGSLTDDYVRAYFYLTNNFTLSCAVFRWLSGALANMGRVTWVGTGGSANKIQLLDNASAQVGISTSVLALNTRHRIEAFFHADTATAQLTVRLFLGANVNGTTPDETITSTTWAGPTTTSGRVDIGCAVPGGASEPSGGGFLYADNIAAGGTDWLGPAAVTGGAPVAPIMMWP